MTETAPFPTRTFDEIAAGGSVSLTYAVTAEAFAALWGGLDPMRPGAAGESGAADAQARRQAAGRAAEGGR